MKDASRWERVFLTASAVFFILVMALAVRTGEEVDLSRPRFFIPCGLLALSAANVRLRSKVMAWSAFSLSFVIFMMVLGPWVVGLRMSAAVETAKFMGAMALYLSLSLTALFQLRAARGG